MSRFRPERADSIGVIVHYTCTHRCAHCLYACRPGLEEAIPPDAFDRLLASIERGCPQASLHVGGGEPFLHMGRLLSVLEGIRRRGLFLEYVETNGFWIRRRVADDWLPAVRAAGCSRLLLSISPFHNAFLSCRDNRRAYARILRTFGPDGIFAWHPAFYPYLERVAPDRPVPFGEYVGHFSAGEIAHQLTGIIYLHPAGRAAVTFAPLLGRRPVEAFLGKHCRPELSSPVHAHVDPSGHYLTGFCSGLQIGAGSAFDLDRLFTEGIDLTAFPILQRLIEGGLGDLYRFAQAKGFRSDPSGYVSACHLCGHIRTWIYHGLDPEERPAELAPGFFYEEMHPLFAPPA